MPRRPAFQVRAAEEEQFIGSAPLSVIDSLSCHRSLADRGDGAWDEDERREPPPLGAKLTGYRLLNLGVILIFGVIKAALGLSSALTTLDWVAGVSLAIMYSLSKFYSIGGADNAQNILGRAAEDSK
jgi:hypothetical protein